MGHQIPALYAAFDVYPAAKGAAIHIREAAGALFNYMGGGLLAVLGLQSSPALQREGSWEIRRFFAFEPNFLKRAMKFGEFVAKATEECRNTLSLVQFRDPWGGIPLLACPERKFRAVYEVNGLPSIELPALYPDLSNRTLEKIRAEEQLCIHESDHIVCPSRTIRECLLNVGADAEKITVIPNGAVPVDGPVPPLPGNAPSRHLIYFGAVQSWQGLETLFLAFSMLADFQDLELVLCISGSKARLKVLERLATRLGIIDRTRWMLNLSQQELLPWLAHANLSIVPLADVPRNMIQGCSPLKILESMAAGVPVLASDIPSVRELMSDGVEGRFVRPNRPTDLARAVRIMLEHPETLAEMGEAGRRKVRELFTWARARDSLYAVYDKLIMPPEKGRMISIPVRVID
ncbi:MAG: glycosyltransferase [Candidatus Riflebacteria bacterium]|nr:glycosyltransferase [Candidatus Riflebacteria bacterium]